MGASFLCGGGGPSGGPRNEDIELASSERTVFCFILLLQDIKIW